MLNRSVRLFVLCLCIICIPAPTMLSMSCVGMYPSTRKADPSTPIVPPIGGRFGGSWTGTAIPPHAVEEARVAIRELGLVDDLATR